jgi:hypothetical protein
VTQLDATNMFDAADTLPFFRWDPGATSIYDLRPAIMVDAQRFRQIQEIRRDLGGLRRALAEGWDVGPELLHEEFRLAALEDAAAASSAASVALRLAGPELAGPELAHEEHRLAALEDAAAAPVALRLAATPALFDWRVDRVPSHPRTRGLP